MKKLFKAQLYKTSEGKIFFIGIVLSFFYLLSLAVYSFISVKDAQRILEITIANIFFGRAAGLTLGYADGFSHFVVIPVNMFVETIVVLLFYSLFLMTFNQLLDYKSLKKFTQKAKKEAKIHEDKVKKYGILGLMLFVWFPFWMTGPIIGAVIGYFLGLQHKVTLSVVLTGTYIAIFSWAIFLKEIKDILSRYSQSAPMALFLFFVFVAVVFFAYKRFHKVKS